MMLRTPESVLPQRRTCRPGSSISVLGCALVILFSGSLACCAQGSPQIQSMQSQITQPQRVTLPNGAVVVGKSQWLVERPLPPFTLYTADDQAAPAQSLVQSGYWFVIYRSRNCEQCDALMQMLSNRSANASRMVFVVSGISGSDLLQLEQKYPNLAQASWLRDLKSNFSSSMNIAGSPHIIGMRNGAIRWQHAGFSTGDATFPAAIDSWLKYNLLPPNKMVRTPIKRPANQKPGATSLAAPAQAKGQQ